ncbi:MAG: hypothetical protein Q9222_005678 [Ikaeria aurantiellina]
MSAQNSQAFLQIIKSLQKGKGSPSTPSDAPTHQFFQQEYRRSSAVKPPSDEGSSPPPDRSRTYRSTDESPEDTWPTTLNYDDEAVEHRDRSDGVPALVETPAFNRDMSEHPSFDSRALTQSDHTDLQVTTRSMTGTDHNTLTATSAVTEVPPPSSRPPSPAPEVLPQPEQPPQVQQNVSLLSNGLDFLQALHSRTKDSPPATLGAKETRWINTSSRAVRNLDEIPLDVIEEAAIQIKDATSNETPILSHQPSSASTPSPPEHQIPAAAASSTQNNNKHIIRPRTSLTPPLTHSTIRRYTTAELKDIGREVKNNLFQTLLAREGNGRVVVSISGGGGRNSAAYIDNRQEDERDDGVAEERGEGEGKVKWPWSSGEA